MSFFKGFRKGMNAFGQSIALLVNTILLTVVYIVGIGVTAVIAKIVRKRFLTLKPSKNAKSYWSDLNLNKRPIREHYRQF